VVSWDCANAWQGYGGRYVGESGQAAIEAKLSKQRHPVLGGDLG